MSIMKRYGLGVALLVSAGVAQADWQLDPERSRVDATVIELAAEGPVPHQHSVRELDGSIDEQGRLRLPLRLNQTDVLEKLGELPPWLDTLTDRTLVTLSTELPPERLNDLAVGDSFTETLLFRADTSSTAQEEPLRLRFTRESDDRIRITNAERIVLNGSDVMQDETGRTIVNLLGYERIGDEIPVELNATLVDR